MKLKSFIAAVFAVLLGGQLTQAQSYNIDWFSVDGGGGASSGGAYQLNGTIGQPDAGKMAGGSYTLDGGFWSIVAAIQEPGAPLLSITQSNNSVVISWPTPATGFVLQENNNLSLPNAWAVISQSASTNNGRISVTVPAGAGSRFYRLKK